MLLVLHINNQVKISEKESKHNLKQICLVISCDLKRGKITKKHSILLTLFGYQILVLSSLIFLFYLFTGMKTEFF